MRTWLTTSRQLNPPAILILIMLLSLFDAIASDRALAGFYMIEGNPTMAHLWEYSRTAFFLYKTGLTNICLTLCVAGIHLRWVRHALRGIACFYSWLAGSHIGLYLYYHAPETLVVWI